MVTVQPATSESLTIIMESYLISSYERRGSVVKSVLTEVRQAGHFAVLADEAIDVSISEQMPLALRFVDSSSQIREEFVAFVLCDTGMSGR